MAEAPGGDGGGGIAGRARLIDGSGGEREWPSQTIRPDTRVTKQAEALIASGQITMRRVDGWQTLGHAPVETSLDLAA